MPTKTSRKYSDYYINDVAIDQSSNAGVDATTRKLQDGAGKNTSMAVSDDVFSVQPVTDDTTGAMLVKNKSGTTVFSVDTVGSIVKCGNSKINALTHYAYFNAFCFTYIYLFFKSSRIIVR